MSANPDFKQCLIDKTQASLVDFVAGIQDAFRANENDLNDIPIDSTVDWARNVLRSSQDVKSPDPVRQALIDDLREFVKDIRKCFTKNANDLNDIPFSFVDDNATALLDRAGYVAPVVSSPAVKRRAPA